MGAAAFASDCASLQPPRGTRCWGWWVRLLLGAPLRKCRRSRLVELPALFTQKPRRGLRAAAAPAAAQLRPSALDGSDDAPAAHHNVQSTGALPLQPFPFNRPYRALCPDVTPLAWMLRVANSTPMVDLLSSENSLRVNRLSRLDLPTPESPISTTLQGGSSRSFEG